MHFAWLSVSAFVVLVLFMGFMQKIALRGAVQLKADALRGVRPRGFFSYGTTWILLGMPAMVVVGLILLYGPYRDSADRWLLSTFLMPVSSVEAGNLFTVRANLAMRRELVLEGTALPADQAAATRAKTALGERIGDLKTTVEFVSADAEEPEPWPVRVSIEGEDLAETMVSEGWLAGTGRLAGVVPVERPALPEAPEAGASAAPSPEGARAAGLPTWLRAILWAIGGLFAAQSFGMVLNRRWNGLIVLLLIGGGAVWSLVTSIQQGVSFVPPLVALGMIVLLGPSTRGANKAYQEMQAKRDAGRR